MKKLICAATVLAVSTARADTIHVSAANCPGPGNGSEAEPYCSVQTAIDNAVDTDEIIVAQGVYLEAAIDFLGKAIRLRSTDPTDPMVVSNTVLDGVGTGLGVVLILSGEGPDTVLDGFTITGGIATGGGGGMAIEFTSPTVSNCVFSGNSAANGGGIFNFFASPTVINCTFSGNSATAGGGIHNFSSNPTVTNCLFLGNTANSGGGMFNSSSNTTVTNCHFTENSADTSGGGMSNFFGSPTVTNCILWGDSPDEITGDTLLVTYSLIQGGHPGFGNIDADPLFIDPDNGDFRLSPGSPCTDAGNNWGVRQDFQDLDGDGDTRELTPWDLDGNPRFNADPADFDPGCGVPVVVDMGAYEFQFDPVEEVFLGDLDGDGTVGIVDFLALLADWGPCEPGCCLADLDIDRDVGIIDFLILLGNWG